jgi:hypothetical protein
VLQLNFAARLFQFYFCFDEFLSSRPLICIISQFCNTIPVAAVCHLVACILHNPELTKLHLKHDPSACVWHAAWQGEGLPLPPRDVLLWAGWPSVLEFLRVRGVCARSRNLPRARRLLCHRAPLQLPSRLSQSVMFRMSSALGAASALLVFWRCSVPARLLQHHALLRAMLSQRFLARVSLQRRQFLGSERLQLLCCGSPLSVLLLRLANVVDRSGRSSAEHRCIVFNVKRYFSGVAHRLWHTPHDPNGGAAAEAAAEQHTQWALAAEATAKLARYQLQYQRDKLV